MKIPHVCGSVVALAALGSVLGGCMRKSPEYEVSRLGPDTYSVGASVGDVAQTRTAALRAAEAYCVRDGLHILVMNVSTQVFNFAGDGTAEVTFRCLKPGDAELRRPPVAPSPNIIIENRQK